MSILKRISFNPLVIRSVRTLGLRTTLRKAYYIWARPRNGIMPVKLGDFDSRFHVRTPEQLRMLGKAQGGQWRIEVIEFLDRRLHSGDVVYDVGSNIGVCSVFAARKVSAKGQVLAFEPGPETYQSLRDNIELNGLANLRAFEVALADYNGRAELIVGDDMLFSSLTKTRNGQTRNQTVRIVEGDSLREELNLPRPNLVMIDVEGSEYATIHGLARTLSDPGCTALACEVHPTLLPSPIEPGNILDSMKSCGFTKIDILRWKGIPEFFAFASKP